MQTFLTINAALRSLHGRKTYDAFGLFLEQIIDSIYHLRKQNYLRSDLEPSSYNQIVLLPNFHYLNPDRLWTMWSTIVYLQYSHKIHNIIRMGSSATFPRLLYLRGSDYEFTFRKERTAISYGSVHDSHFQLNVLNKLSEDFSVIKVISPTDLARSMKAVDLYFGSNRKKLSLIAEFARVSGGGLYMNPSTWKDDIQALIPFSSVFCVYVSNQSNGLQFELECLAKKDLFAHTVLVLDPERTRAHEAFVDKERQILAANHNAIDLQFSAAKDASVVSDVEAFEDLIAKFPNQIEVSEFEDDLYEKIRFLLKRNSRKALINPSPIPFDFKIHLNSNELEQVKLIHEFVAEKISSAYLKSVEANWPVLTLYLEIDLFLHLINGSISSAAISTARYGAIAKCANAYLKASAPELAENFGVSFERHGDIATNIALDAFAMGEWNEFQDRRMRSQSDIQRTSTDTAKLFSASLTSGKQIAVFKRLAKGIEVPSEGKFKKLEAIISKHFAE